MLNLKCDVKFNEDQFEREIREQIEQKVKRALLLYPNVKANVDVSSGKINLDGPDDEVAAAKEAIQRAFR